MSEKSDRVGKVSIGRVCECETSHEQAADLTGGVCKVGQQKSVGCSTGHTDLGRLLV